VWKFYNKKNMKLKNISRLHAWPVRNVLIEKYRLKPSEADSLSKFLERMLKWKPKDRHTARELLDDPWLKENDEYSVWLSKNYLKEYKLVHRQEYPGFLEELKKEKEKERLAEEKRKQQAENKDSSESESSSESSSSGIDRDFENKEAFINGEQEFEDDEESSGS